MLIRTVVGYIRNPDCPNCEGQAGTLRRVAYGELWGEDFMGDGRGRRNVFTTLPFHCPKCAVYSVEEEM
jgi:hypothetical protein